MLYFSILTLSLLFTHLYLYIGASTSDAYALTSGNKQMNHWKWLGSAEQYIGQSGPEYWFNDLTKVKPNYNCQAMYLRDSMSYGKWVGLPCYNAAPYTCEYHLAPPGSMAPANSAETLAMMEIYKDSPPYLSASAYSKGASYANSKGNSLAASAYSKGMGYAAPSYKGGYRSYGMKGF